MKKEHRIHGIFIFVLILIFLTYVEILRVFPEVAKRELSQSIRISANTVGLMGTFALYIYLFVQVFIGIIYDRISLRIVIPSGVLLCAVGGFFFGWSYNIPLAFIAQGMMAVGSTFAFLGGLIVIQRWFARRHFAMLAGVLQTVGAFGIFSAGIPNEALLHYYSSWRVVMIVLGSIGIVLGLMYLMVVQDNPEDEFIVPTSRRFLRQVREIFSSSQMWWAALVAAFGWGPLIAVVGVLGGPLLQKRYMLSLNEASDMITFCWLGLGISGPLIGYLSDAIGRRLSLLYFCSALGALSSLLLIFLPGSSLIVAGVVLFALGVAAGGQILTFPFVKENTPSTSMGTAVGLNNMAAIFGGIVAQSIMGGVLASFSSHTLTAFRVAFLVVPLFFTLAFIISLFLLKETYCKQQVR